MLTHCFLIHLSFAFFKMFLISVFTFLYISLPSMSPFFLFSYLLLSHRSRMSEVTHGFFMRRCLPRISLAVSVTATFITVIIIVSMSLFSFSSRMSGTNFPHIFAWKAFATVGSFSFSRSYCILVLVGFMILFRRSRKVIIRSSFITSCICSWEAPSTVDVYTGAETFLDLDVINLIMCFPIETMPWMVCVGRKCSLKISHYSLQIPVVEALCHLSVHCCMVRTFPSSPFSHLLQLSHSSHPVL